MKFLKYILLVLSLAALVGLTSCRKVSHNGKLDGQWQIRSIENTETGVETSPDPELYICIDLHILQLTGGPRLTANMTYDKDAETISCDFPYVKDEDVETQLGAYGIFSNPVKMDIVKLDGKSLVIRTDKSIITCRRF